MSDLLIKGMKIPSCCDRCFYRCFCSAHARQVQKIMESDAVQVFDIFGEMRLEDCPLVEVKPHGELIDKDAVLDILRTYLQMVPIDAGIANRIYEIVYEAPTVLEASVNKDDDHSYEMQSDMRDYCDRYEPTYNPEDGSM